MANDRKPARAARPLETRLRVARAVTLHREENPGRTVEAAIKELGLKDVTVSNYYTWLAELRKHDQAKADASEPEPSKGNGEDRGAEEHFPLEAIPDRPQHPLVRRLKSSSPDTREEDRKIAAALLEVAARLLKR